MWIRVCPNWQMKSSTKKDWKRSFSYETKHQCHFSQRVEWPDGLNHERNEIIMWICLCSNWQTNFDSKIWLEEKLFKWNQSINVIFPNARNEFMVPNHEKNKDNYESMFFLFEKWTLTIKNGGMGKLFLFNQSIKVIYPNEDNEFMVPNHEDKGDYYVNPCLSQLKNGL